MSLSVRIEGPSPGGDKDSDRQKDDSNVFGTWKNRRQSVVSGSVDEEPKTPSKASMLRRGSTFKGIATSLLTMRRMTKGRITEPEPPKPKVQMENTYKTEPDEGKMFKTKRVEDLVTNILEKELCNEKYNPARCKNLTCDLSVLIKSKIKDLNFPRYRIICNVVIGQCLEQGIEMASQCIWSPSTDNYSCSSYKNNSLFAVATVHAVYFE